MEFKVEDYILSRGHNFIDWCDFKEIVAQVKQKYYFSSPDWWLWKLFEIGYIYGKRAERKRRATKSA